MHALLEIALSNAVVALAMAVLIVAVGRLTYKPALLHCLWLLLLVKLITPSLVTVPVSVDWMASRPNAQVEPLPEFPPDLWDTLSGRELPEFSGRLVRDGEAIVWMWNWEIEGHRAGVWQPLGSDFGRVGDGLRRPEALLRVGTPSDPAVGATAIVLDDDRVAYLAREGRIIRNPKPLAAEPPLARSWRWWGPVLLWLWPLGSLVWVTLAFVRIRRFQRLLQFAVPASPQLQDEAAELARRLGLGRCPTVWIVPGAISPMVWGFAGRARLLFPRTLLTRLDDDARQTLLLHELAHLRRRDHWTRIVEFSATALYWWHPVVWWACSRIHVTEEECCDALVVQHAPGGPRTYAVALLETIDYLAEARPALPPAASGIGQVECLRRRLIAIMQEQAVGQLSRRSRWSLYCAAAMLFPLWPTWIHGEAGRIPGFESILLASAYNERGSGGISRPPGEREIHSNEQRPSSNDRSQSPLASAVLANDSPNRAASESSGLGAARALDGTTGSAPAEVSPLVEAVERFAPSIAEPLAGSSVRQGAQDRQDVLTDDPATELWPILTHDVPETRAIALSPDGRTLAVAGEDHTVQLRSAETGRIRTVLTGHSDVVSHVAFSFDGMLLATASYDGTVKLWDVVTGAKRHTLVGHANWVFCVAFLPHSQRLASGGYDKTIRIWDAAASREIDRLDGHTGTVRTVAVSPDGTLLASGGGDRSVRLWDLRQGKPIAVLTGHTGAVRSLTFSPDGQALATAAEDKTVRLWDVATQTEQNTLKDHEAMVWCLAYSHDGLSLAGGGLDTIVRLWNTESGEQTQILRGHRDAITTLTFAGESHNLITGSRDRTIRRWTVQP
jgi:WD40 repeat protein/beta-lactamase regulating signal transducer with metallopeptidase domain